MTVLALAVLAGCGDDRQSERTAACVDEIGAGSQQISCHDMTFEVAVPEVCPERGCGLIADVHGGDGACCSGDFADRHSNLRALGTAAGYVVVQPNVPGSTEQSVWVRGEHDVRVREFMEALVETLNLDHTRVHVGGFSNGGRMTWYFVCDHADFVASVAPSGAAASFVYDGGEPFDTCDFDEPGHPSDEVDILMVHGRFETDVPFDTALTQMELITTSWEMIEVDPIGDETDYRWSRWVNRNGTVVEFIEHDWSGGWLGGHCYPGVTAPVGCGADTPIHYGEAALQFYIDHPKDD